MKPRFPRLTIATDRYLLRSNNTYAAATATLWRCREPMTARARPNTIRTTRTMTGGQHDNAADEPWQLVKAAQEGDTEAFGVLYDKYVDMVFRYVLFRVGGDRAFAEDVTSETFLRALRSIASVSYQGRDVGAWFVTIARNIVFDHVKSSRYRLEVTTAELQDNREETSGPEQEVMTEATNAELLRCVSQLGDDQRECITLRFIEGKTVSEVAQLMDRNEGAVKALQHRAVRRLAQILPSWLR
jgi:RNA polymerase sigma-70 factor (ECF subfamily)